MKKFLILGVVTVVALAALSVGYALWSKTLTITGTVSTGNIAANWTAVGASDTEVSGKDASSIECHVGVGPSEEPTELYVNLTNAYPSIVYTCNFTVTSTGTVPIHFIGPVMDQTPDPNCLDINVTDLEGTQLHLGDSVSGSVTVHLQNSCPQSDEISFHFKTLYYQYNEDAEAAALPMAQW